MLDFTFKGYFELVRNVQSKGFSLADFHDYHQYERSCILRHDIDMSIGLAFRFAAMEAELSPPIRSTYFVLLKTDMYNPLSKKSVSYLKDIIKMGHEIGLHFDEAAYDIEFGLDNLVASVQNEARVLSEYLGSKIRTVSMHRPSKRCLEANLKFDGLVNSYGHEYFKDIKYLSDSRRHWREDPYEVISSGNHKKYKS